MSLRCCIYDAHKCLNANLTILSMIHFVLCSVEHETSFITSTPVLAYHHVSYDVLISLKKITCSANVYFCVTTDSTSATISNIVYSLLFLFSKYIHLSHLLTHALRTLCYLHQLFCILHNTFEYIIMIFSTYACLFSDTTDS